jgi:membrane protease YdiL (CAAX protease family)
MTTLKKENLLKTIVVSLLFPILYFVILFLFDNGYGLIWKLNHAGATTADLNAQIATAAYPLLLATIVLFFLITIIIFAVRKQNLLKRVSWNPVPKKSIYGFAILLGVGLIFASMLLSVIIPQSWSANDITTSDAGQNVVLVVLMTAIIAPIAEETAFRGLMMGHLQNRVAPWIAVALPALAFCIFHMGDSFGHVFGVIPLAVSVGLVFYWTRSIRVTILIHIVYNGIVSIIQALAGTDTSDTTTSISAGIITARIVAGFIGLVIVVLALSMIYKRRQRVLPTIKI